MGKGEMNKMREFNRNLETKKSCYLGRERFYKIKSQQGVETKLVSLEKTRDGRVKKKAPIISGAPTLCWVHLVHPSILSLQPSPQIWMTLVLARTGGWGPNLSEAKCFAIDSEMLRYGTQGAVLSDLVNHHEE